MDAPAVAPPYSTKFISFSTKTIIFRTKSIIFSLKSHQIEVALRHRVRPEEEDPCELQYKCQHFSIGNQDSSIGNQGSSIESLTCVQHGELEVLALALAL